MTAWQVGIACIVLLGSFVLEHLDFLAMSCSLGSLVRYSAVSLGIVDLTWFAALRRLEAGTRQRVRCSPDDRGGRLAITLGAPLLFPQFALPCPGRHRHRSRGAAVMTPVGQVEQSGVAHAGTLFLLRNSISFHLTVPGNTPFLCHGSLADRESATHVVRRYPS